MLSKTCTYGLQAAIYIASQPHNELVGIQTIADSLNISFHFLTKVLQQLTAAGLLISQRGVHGGVMLAKNSEDITLYDIISVIEGRDKFEQCIMGLPGCGSAVPCPLHEHWSSLRTEIGRVFIKTKLSELADSSNRLNLRLAHPELINGISI
ncbi:MAG: Rrf2 family transcriptional regulator [Candidatus Kapabacteria bacterium]|nr:Rrf2 family transcriptional regulator [Candidatus Kapabacteria bacterium]